MNGKHERPRPHRDTLRMQFIQLLELKSVLSLALVGATIWGFMEGRLPSEYFVGVVSSVVTYFFARKKNHGDNGNGGTEQ